MFRNINDIIHYVRGDWAKENNLMDDYLKKSNKKLQILVDNYDDGTNIGEQIVDYGNDVYILGMLSGARFGRNEVLKIISDMESKQ